MGKHWILGICFILVLLPFVSALKPNTDLMNGIANSDKVFDQYHIPGEAVYCYFHLSYCENNLTACEEYPVEINMSYSAGPYDQSCNDDFYWCSGNYNTIQEGVLVTLNTSEFNGTDTYFYYQFANSTTSLVGGMYWCKVHWHNGSFAVSSIYNGYVQAPGSPGFEIEHNDPLCFGSECAVPATAESVDAAVGGAISKNLRAYNPMGYDNLDAAFNEWVKGEDFEHFFSAGFDLIKSFIAYIFNQPGSLVPMGGVS